MSCDDPLENNLINTSVQEAPWPEVLSDLKSIFCNNSRFFGKIEICLPVIDGMTESYSHPKVKKRSDLFSYDNNTILGIYLCKEDNAELENFESIDLDDYFKVYAIKKSEGMEIGKSEFEQLEEYSINNYDQKEWEELKDKVLSGTSRLSVGRPVQIEIYKPKEEISTTLLIAKLMSGSEERISVFTISMVRLKKTVIFYSYYKNYSSPKTIEQVIAKNDLFGYKLLEANK